MTHSIDNLFDLSAFNPDGPEFFETLLQKKNLRIERIISAGHCSDVGFWYDQEESEWVCLLQGEAVIGLEDGSAVQLRPGSSCFLPARLKHRVEYTSTEPPCIWLAVFWND